MCYIQPFFTRYAELSHWMVALNTSVDRCRFESELDCIGDRTNCRVCFEDQKEWARAWLFNLKLEMNEQPNNHK